MLKFCVALFTCGFKFQSSTQVCILNNISYWLLPNPCLTSPLLWEHPCPGNLLSGSAEVCVCVCVCVLVTQSCLTLATPWTVAHQASLSMEISREEYWRGLPFLLPGGSSWPRDQTQVSRIAGGFFTVWATKEAPAVAGTSSKTKGEGKEWWQNSYSFLHHVKIVIGTILFHPLRSHRL